MIFLNKNNMEELNKLTLKALKKMYPSISARSKDDMLDKIAKAMEVVEEEIIESKNDKTAYDPNNSELTWYNIEDFIFSVCNSSEKFLIKTPTSLEADLMFSRLNQEVFTKLIEKGISVMASSTRRDMHLNGKCYIRLVCHTNFEHVRGFINYTKFKQLV